MNLQPVQANPKVLGIAAALIAITLALYAQVTGFEFLNYDDDTYVTTNAHVLEGLTLEGAGWAATTGYAANWHPLTWLSHMLDVELFGLDAAKHHLVSAGLHALNTALLFLALHWMTRRVWPCVLVALLFALHPLRVESVAWVAERKDVLSGFFFMATLAAYARYVRQPCRATYLWVGVLFGLGLLAKPMLVTMPALFLLLDHWPLNRWYTADPGERRRLLLEKVPWFAMALISMVVTCIVQQKGGAVNPLYVLGFEERLSNGFASYARYALQTLWPTSLSAIYIHPGLMAGEGYAPWTRWSCASVIFVLGTSLAAWRFRRRLPVFITGWFWFLGMALPVIGLIQVGYQAHADRYTYLPSIGLLCILVFGIEGWTKNVKWARIAAGVAGVLGCGALFALSWRQIATWRDTRTVFEHALAVSETNFIAHTNLGQALHHEGRLEQARKHYLSAIDLRPNLFPVRTNLAQIHIHEGRLHAALAELEEALRYGPAHGPALLHKGLALAGLGRDRQAVETLRTCLAVNPSDPYARNQLAWILATSSLQDLRSPEEALRHARTVCEAAGHANPAFLETLAAALAASNRFEEAVERQRQAQRLSPPQEKKSARTRLELYRLNKPLIQSPPNPRRRN